MITTALQIADSYISHDLVRETRGKNRSIVIDDIVRIAGGVVPSDPKADGPPYCAAGLTACVKKAVKANDLDLSGALMNDDHGGRIIFPYSMSSQAIMRRYRLLGLCYGKNWDCLLGMTAALGGWTDPDGDHGHIYFIGERFTDASSHVSEIGTWEFNTSPQTKGRDGQGAYHLRRNLEELRATHPNFWVCDLSHTIGCGAGLTEWWGKNLVSGD